MRKPISKRPIPHNAPTPPMTPPTWHNNGPRPSPPIPALAPALPFNRRDATKNDFFPDPADQSRYYGGHVILHKQCGGELRYDVLAHMHKCSTCWSEQKGGGFWRMTTVQHFTDADIGQRFWTVDK